MPTPFLGDVLVEDSSHLLPILLLLQGLKRVSRQALLFYPHSSRFLAGELLQRAQS